MNTPDNNWNNCWGLARRVVQAWTPEEMATFCLQQLAEMYREDKALFDKAYERCGGLGDDKEKA